MGFASPELKYDVKHALVFEDDILPPKDGLKLSIRVFGVKPSLKRLHCFVKFKWDLSAQFTVSLFKDSTFELTFSNVPDFLRAADCSWDFVDDRVIKVSCDPLELLHQDNFRTLCQWVLITGMTESMWSN